MNTISTSTADFRFPAKNVKFLRILRYDGPNSRRPHSPATIAHNFDHTVVKYMGFSVICWLFQPRADHFKREPAVLVYNIGARTGKMREAVLTAFTEDSGAWIVVATNGGIKNQPGWVFNLRRNPVCWVRRRWRNFEAVAEELSGDEQDRVFAWLAERYPVLIPYSKKVAAHDRDLSMWRIRKRTASEMFSVAASDVSASANGRPADGS